jgi:hypothetical protein
MRKSLIPLAALPLPLAACATTPYGSPYGYNDPVIGAIGALGSVLGAGQSGYASPYGYSNYGYGGGGGGFTQAAVNACANYASRYGQVQVRSVQQTSSSKVHVYGTASNGYYGRNFDCSFRSDGRVSDFDI